MPEVVLLDLQQAISHSPQRCAETFDEVFALVEIAVNFHMAILHLPEGLQYQVAWPTWQHSETSQEDSQLAHLGSPLVHAFQTHRLLEEVAFLLHQQAFLLLPWASPTHQQGHRYQLKVA